MYLGLINVSADPPEAGVTFVFYLSSQKHFPTEVSIAHDHFHGTVRPARSQETVPALMASGWYILAGMCLFVLFMIRRTA